MALTHQMSGFIWNQVEVGLKRVAKGNCSYDHQIKLFFKKPEVRSILYESRNTYAKMQEIG